jgi:hypothetical protein
MNQKIKAVFLTFSALTLTACGGSKDSEFKLTPEVELVVENGQFKESSNTNVYFGNNFGPDYLYSNEFGSNAEHCYREANNYYFETEHALVFGSSTLPESDFKTVAMWVESQLDQAASAFNGMSFSNILAKRNNIAPEINRVLQAAIGGIKLDAIDYPENYDEMDRFEVQEWFATYFRGLDVEKQNEIIDDASITYGRNWQRSDYRIPDKLLVCLHEGTNQFQYGEGTRFGINLGAPSINTPHDPQVIVKHELVHTFQAMLYDSSYNAFMLPTWFAEGQAVFMSGQKVAKIADSADFHTTHYVYFDDRGNTDPADLYEHYGLAYKYLHDANGIAKMVEVITGMSNSQSNSLNLDYNFDPAIHGVLDYDFNDGYSSHRYPFIESFDKANLVDANGAPLSLRRYKRDYDIIVK